MIGLTVIAHLRMDALPPILGTVVMNRWIFWDFLGGVLVNRDTLRTSWPWKRIVPSAFLKTSSTTGLSPEVVCSIESVPLPLLVCPTLNFCMPIYSHVLAWYCDQFVVYGGF